MRFYDPLLYPFAVLYGLATGFRNRLFDIGTKKIAAFTLPVIVVGNLSVGGTGKTPMVELLIRLFQDSVPLAVLSRGYGRKTQGFILADTSADSDRIGDESFQLYQKFGDKVAVAVGEARALAIPLLLAEKPKTRMVVLDDAFQHRYVSRDVNILLTTFQKPFFSDRILPLGTLRESRQGASRADVVVVTKCPHPLDDEIRNYYRENIQRYAGVDTPVIFAGIRYSPPVPLINDGKSGEDKAILVTGIAANEPFVDAVRSSHEVLEVLEFPDHYRYKEEDVKKILQVYRKYKDQRPVILTTEKDAVKLKANQFLPFWTEIPIFALPMEVDMNDEDCQLIEGMILKVIKEKRYQGEE